MAEITVDIDDYVSKDDIAEMVRDSVRYQIHQKVKDTIEWHGYDTIVANVAYSVVRYLLEEQGFDFEEILVEKTKDVINSLSAYTVFYDGAEFNSRGNQSTYKAHGRVVLDEVVDELKPEIESKIRSIIEDKIDADYLVDAATDAFKKELEEQLS